MPCDFNLRVVCRSLWRLRLNFAFQNSLRVAGQVTSVTYDALNRAKLLGYNTVVNGGVTSYESTISYAYDAGNRITQVTDSTGGMITEAYDNLNRLITETTDQGSVTYGYDNAGRRTSMIVAGQPQVSYSYDNGNRLTQIAQGTSSVGFSYDNINRRTSMTLHEAASKGHVEAVKFLLEHGAYSNVRNEFGRTPLDVAELNGHAEVVKLLRSKENRE